MGNTGNKQIIPVPPTFGSCRSRGKCFWLPVLSKRRNLGGFTCKYELGNAFGWFSELTKKGSAAFGSFPFSHLSGCVLQLHVGIFGIWGTQGGVLHVNEIPWQQELGKEFLENPPKLLHSSGLVQGRGKSSQTTTN